MILVAESNMEPSYAIKREVMHRGQNEHSPIPGRHAGSYLLNLPRDSLTLRPGRSFACLSLSPLQPPGPCPRVMVALWWLAGLQLAARGLQEGPPTPGVRGRL